MHQHTLKHTKQGVVLALIQPQTGQPTHAQNTYSQHFLWHATSTWVKESFISAWVPLGRLAYPRTQTHIHTHALSSSPPATPSHYVDASGPPLSLHGHINKHKHWLNLANKKYKWTHSHRIHFTNNQCIHSSNGFVSIKKLWSTYNFLSLVFMGCGIEKHFTLM